MTGIKIVRTNNCEKQLQTIYRPNKNCYGSALNGSGTQSFIIHPVVFREHLDSFDKRSPAFPKGSKRESENNINFDHEKRILLSSF